jgi:ribosome-binding ATPase YchF (GTP1/OBG family)
LENSEVLKKVDNMFELTESQKDRQLISNLIKKDLLGFLQSQISRVTSGSELRQMVETQLKERLEPLNADEEGLSDGMLLRLYEIISANEANTSGKILELFKETQKVIIQNNNEGSETQKKHNVQEFSKEEVQSTKKLLDLLSIVEDLKKTEFNPEESEKEKQ